MKRLQSECCATFKFNRLSCWPYDMGFLFHLLTASFIDCKLGFPAVSDRYIVSQSREVSVDRDWWNLRDSFRSCRCDATSRLMLPTRKGSS